MYLAFLGFGMIVVFMALIMAKKLSPFTSLIIIPVLFGLLAGYGWDTLEYAMTGHQGCGQHLCHDDLCHSVLWRHAHCRYV